MKISKIEIKILIDLYKSIEGLTPYTFYQRYKFSAATVYKTVSKFEKKDFLKTKEDKIIITQKGKTFVEKSRFVFDSEKFARLPNEFIVPKVKVNEPYIPNITVLSK